MRARTNRNLDRYQFTVRPLSNDEGGGYLVEYPDIPGCMSDGDTIEEAIALVNGRSYGNMACIFTTDGANARRFRYEVNAGNVGVNVGVAAPMSTFPFSGWGESFFGDLHAQAHHAVEFFTQTKVVVERWPRNWSRKF